MAHNVKCKICGETFDRDKIPAILVSSRRYAHETCVGKTEKKELKENQELIELENYIKNLLGEDYVNAKVRKQIKEFRKEYNYSYNGILKTLQYWYDIKQNNKSAANGGIGIVPFVYKQARDYYYTSFMVDQLNAGKTFQRFDNMKKVVEIPAPKRKEKQIRLFNLEEEGDKDE